MFVLSKRVPQLSQTLYSLAGVQGILLVLIIRNYESLILFGPYTVSDRTWNHLYPKGTTHWYHVTSVRWHYLLNTILRKLTNSYIMSSQWGGSLCHDFIAPYSQDGYRPSLCVSLFGNCFYRVVGVCGLW